MHFDSCGVRGPSKRPISLVKNVQFHLRFLSMKPFCMSVWYPVGLSGGYKKFVRRQFHKKGPFSLRCDVS